MPQPSCPLPVHTLWQDFQSDLRMNVAASVAAQQNRHGGGRPVSAASPATLPAQQHQQAGGSAAARAALGLPQSPLRAFAGPELAGTASLTGRVSPPRYNAVNSMGAHSNGQDPNPGWSPGQYESRGRQAHTEPAGALARGAGASAGMASPAAAYDGGVYVGSASPGGGLELLDEVTRVLDYKMSEFARRLEVQMSGFRASPSLSPVRQAAQPSIPFASESLVFLAMSKAEGAEKVAADVKAELVVSVGGGVPG